MNVRMLLSAHRPSLRPSPVSSFEPVKSPACAAPSPNGQTPTKTVVAPGTNLRKSTQKFISNRGCIVGSSRSGDWIEADWAGAEQIIRRRVRIVVRGTELRESVRGRHLRVVGKEQKPGREQTERRKILLIQEKSNTTQGTKNRKEQRPEQLYNYKMPELRTSSRPALTDISGGGFFIRRVESPGAVLVKGAAKPRARQALSPSSNKENVPPVGWVAPKRRSPLPDWYPRTPLRDITSIVKAIERRSRLQNAAAQQQILWTEDSSQSVDPITPAQAEQGVATTEGGQAVPSPATSLEDGKLKASSSPSDCSLQATPSKPDDPALADLMEKKLSSSIEQIEKMVRRNLKKTLKAAQPSKRTIQRRTLMSMR